LSSIGWTPMAVIFSGAVPRSCASARMSLKPVWCGEIFFAPQAGTSASRSTLSVPPDSP